MLISKYSEDKQVSRKDFERIDDHKQVFNYLTILKLSLSQLPIATIVITQ